MSIGSNTGGSRHAFLKAIGAEVFTRGAEK